MSNDQHIHSGQFDAVNHYGTQNNYFGPQAAYRVCHMAHKPAFFVDRPDVYEPPKAALLNEQTRQIGVVIAFAGCEGFGLGALS